ncbi:hypothetical protein DCE93_12190 [Agromyces badenianii]|uniref:Uncharacterized protein n=1 Tax=Agromyces badenianii TaxID=2080742 RepID=A0A2S0WYM7_9MICO|nr:hypothetical protein [Agromyces badenianii]AWB96314.1 hypothetical protein DCE93_12190 [Agromyces badenianii]
MTATMRRVLIAVVAAAVVILGAALVLDNVAAGDRREVAAESTSAPGTSDDPASGSEAGSDDPDDAEERGSSGDDGIATEVLPPITGSAGLPAPVEYAPLVTMPLPPTAAATGAIVEGFPAKVPVFDGSEIVTSSVSIAGDRMQAALEAEADVAPQAVLDFYVARLGALGLQGTDSPAVGGSRALAFVRENDSLVVTVTGAGAGTRYTVFGTLTAAKG